jgi:endonuclease YncB( thermonuclease family)
LLVGEEIVLAEVEKVEISGAVRLEIDGRLRHFRFADATMATPDSQVGKKAHQFLKNRLQGKPVEVHILGYGRDGVVALGYLVRDGVDFRRELIERGLARYCPGRTLDVDLGNREREAQKRGLGMWSKANRDSIPGCPDGA